VVAVSVVVPTFNQRALLPSAVRSVLLQTVGPLEVIVIDDGSTDGTEAISASLPPMVRYIRQENAGVSAARNRGIREARGDWVAFADADDEWLPNKLEVQLAAVAAAPQCRWSVAGCDVIDLQGDPVPKLQGWRVFPVFREHRLAPGEFFGRTLARLDVNSGESRHRVYTGDAFPLLFLGNFGLPSSLLVHRELLSQTRGFDERFRLAEETEYCHRLAAESPVAIVESSLVRYRINHGGLTASRNNAELYSNALLSLDRATRLRPVLSRVARDSYRKGRTTLLLRLGYHRLTELDRAGARAAALQAWRTWGRPSVRSALLFGASLLPVRMLRGLHALKRALRV
jgi:glycosyltransferase involved in cell wall biosynthesis